MQRSIRLNRQESSTSRKEKGCLEGLGFHQLYKLFINRHQGEPTCIRAHALAHTFMHTHTHIYQCTHEQFTEGMLYMCKLIIPVCLFLFAALRALLYLILSMSLCHLSSTSTQSPSLPSATSRLQLSPQPIIKARYCPAACMSICHVSPPFAVFMTCSLSC